VLNAGVGTEGVGNMNVDFVSTLLHNPRDSPDTEGVTAAQ
jgi:hypothetical protein